MTAWKKKDGAWAALVLLAGLAFPVWTCAAEQGPLVRGETVSGFDAEAVDGSIKHVTFPKGSNQCCSSSSAAPPATRCRVEPGLRAPAAQAE